MPILSFKVQVSFCNLLFHYSAHLKRARFLYLAFRPDQQKISKLSKSTKIENKSGRHILYYNGAKKTKENISIVTLLQHFDDIFELHPSLDIENVCFRNLRIEGFKNTLALL